jgi:hypothetical protein
MTTLTGAVVRRRVNVGSKGERVAVLLVGEHGEVALRREGGHAFKDPELDALEGKRIEAEGESAGATFIMKRWREV